MADVLTRPVVAPRPATRAWWDRVDVSTLLIAYIVLLLFVPAPQVVSALGGAGSPAVIFGLGLFGIWAFLRLTKSPLINHSVGGLHFAWLGFAIASLASYVNGMSAPIGLLEMNGADRGLIFIASWSGVVLLALDGLTTRRQLDRVLTALALALVTTAAIALSQYLLNTNWYSQLPFPGLTTWYPTGNDERSGFLRIIGTSTHAIEYGVVQAMGVALVLHMVISARSTTRRVLWGAGTALILCTLPLTIARSSVVGLAIVALVLVPTWPRRWKIRALIASPFALLLAKAAFPGILGTLLSLFTFISADPSTSGRTQDYAEVAKLGLHNPLFGSGINTLIPKIYFTVDNEYIVTFLTMGILGVVALVGVFATAVFLAMRARARSSDPVVRSLAQSLLAGVAVAMVSWAIFDGFGFQQATGMLLLMLGAVGALVRIGARQTADAESSDEGPAGPITDERPSRRVSVMAAASLAAATLVLGVLNLSKTAHYVAETALLFHTVDTSEGLLGSFTDPLAYSAATWMHSDEARSIVRARGAEAIYQVAQGDGSLAAHTDVIGSGPIVRIGATGATPEDSALAVEVATAVMRDRISDEQLSSGSTAEQLIVAATITSTGPVEISNAPTRYLAGLVLLAGLVGLLVLSIGTLLAERQRRKVRARRVEGTHPS